MTALTSQLSPVARIDAAREIERDVEYATPTPNAVIYAKYEAAMIEEAAKLQKRRNRHAETTMGDNRTNEARADDCRQMILAQMDEPKSVKDIAAAVGRRTSTVSTRLMAMRELGLVDYSDPGRLPNGYCQPRIWRKLPKAMRANVQANIDKGERSRAEVLEAVNGNTVQEIAEATDRSPRSMQAVMRQLEREGLVKRGGYGPKPDKGAAPILWVRT